MYNVKRGRGRRAAEPRPRGARRPGAPRKEIDFMNEIIDYRPYMVSECKVYVDVSEVRLKDGKLYPLSFVWEDGNRYEIDRIIDVRNAASLKAGGAGVRYTVRIRGQDKYMFLEEDLGVTKWFMERK